MATVALNGFTQIDNRDIVDLTPHELLVLLGIKAHFRSNPTQEDLARTIGISVSAVKRAIKALIERGRLTVARVGRKGVGASRYLISEGHTDTLTPVSAGQADPLNPDSAGHTDPHIEDVLVEDRTQYVSRLAARQGGTDTVIVGGLPGDEPEEETAADLGARPTHKTCVALFRRRARQIGQVNYPIGVVHRTIRVLREEKGLDYRGVADVIETFFARYEVDARNADNVATLFRYHSNAVLNFARKQRDVRDEEPDDQSWKSDTARKRDEQMAQIAARMKEQYGW